MILLEGAKVGGYCLNSGSVPSKALLVAAKNKDELASHAKNGASQMSEQTQHRKGLSCLARVVVEISPMTVRTVLNGLVCAFCKHLFAFLRPDTLQAGKFDITARRIVIETNSHPAIA